MQEREMSALQKVVKDELGNRGYVVNIDTRREGEFLVGKVQVTSAETDETVAKIVGAGPVDGMRLCFGIDAEGTIREIVTRALSTFQGVQALIPPFILKTSKP